ncbi:MAG: c-type cytochrome biogenesis protein CcsB [Candidatus Nanopelagicaceae bacterium]|jgi:cytochrome c-type biogenesis protein CcsB|nr:c-type cytochrome biogenesis protein CcsB [Actinomycetales bacterium]
MTGRDWAYLSNDLIYVALFAYAFSFLGYAFATAFSVKPGGIDRSTTKRSNRIATIFFIIATAALTLGVIARGLSATRVPWGNMYEFSITGALTFAIAYLIIGRKYDLRWLGLPITILILIILGTAITLLYRPSAPLVPALQSTWLVVHVAAAIFSGGLFLLSNTVASAYLWIDRMERRGGRSEFAKRLPSLEVLDQLSYRLVAFVFPLWTFAIIAGAIWAEAAWGRYWGWDPKETWSFITWILYAAYLHARVTAGWKGRKAAWLSLIAGSSYLFNYVYINVWGTGRHTYSGL